MSFHWGGWTRTNNILAASPAQNTQNAATPRVSDGVCRDSRPNRARTAGSKRNEYEIRRRATRALVALSAVAAALAVACGAFACGAVGVVSPFDRHCYYKGDTVGLLRGSSGGVVTRCVWFLADSTQCFPGTVRPLVHFGCVVGGAA